MLTKDQVYDIWSNTKELLKNQVVFLVELQNQAKANKLGDLFLAWVKSSFLFLILFDSYF